MKEKKLIIFIPSVEGGGVEKNFFLVSNYLSQRFRNVSVITADKNITPDAISIIVSKPVCQDNDDFNCPGSALFN